MKLAFVVPRYGKELAGGAETLVREYAHRLAQEGCQVEVLTTCARDPFTWDNYYPEGVFELDGVRLRRFKLVERQNNGRFLELGKRISQKEPLSLEEEEEWLKLLFSCPDLYSFIEEEGRNYDYLLFAPYLFGTTYFGSRLYPSRSIIIPCLHENEPFASMKMVKEMLTCCYAVLFNSRAEQEFALRRYGPIERWEVVGLGFERYTDYHSQDFRHKFGILGDFVLYAGRRELFKNTPLLVEYFCNYLRKTKRPLKLALVGEGEVNIPLLYADHVLNLGFLDQTDRMNAYAAARVFCQPSINESFSIVVFEAWLAGRPVLVNEKCPVTRNHCLESNGGLCFSDYASFHEALSYLLANPEVANNMGRKGQIYTLKNYSWEKVMPRLLGALERWRAA